MYKNTAGPTVRLLTDDELVAGADAIFPDVLAALTLRRSVSVISTANRRRHLDGRSAGRGPHPVAQRRLAHRLRKRGPGPFRRPRRHRGRYLRRVLRCSAGRPLPPHAAPCHRQRAALRRRRVHPAGRAHRLRQRRGRRTALPRCLVIRTAPTPHHHARLRRIDRRYWQPGADPGRPDHQSDLRLAAGRHRRGARPDPHPCHLVRTRAVPPPAAVPRRRPDARPRLKYRDDPRSTKYSWRKPMIAEAAVAAYKAATRATAGWSTTLCDQRPSRRPEPSGNDGRAW